MILVLGIPSFWPSEGDWIPPDMVNKLDQTGMVKKFGWLALHVENAFRSWFTICKLYFYIYISHVILHLTYKYDVVMRWMLFDMYFYCLFSQPVTRNLHDTGRCSDHLVSIWKLPFHLGPRGGWQHRNTWQSHFCFRDSKYHKGSCKSEGKGSSKGGSKSNLAWLLDFEMFC